MRGSAGPAAYGPDGPTVTRAPLMAWLDSLPSGHRTLIRLTVAGTKTTGGSWDRYPPPAERSLIWVAPEGRTNVTLAPMAWGFPGAPRRLIPVCGAAAASGRKICEGLWLTPK